MKNFSIAAAAIPLLLASSIVHANNEFHKIYAAADLEIESELVKFTNRDLTRPMSTGQQGVETNINENADHRVMEEATSVDDDAQKIVGSEEVKPPGKYPYITYAYGCGASLVAPNVLLSAAHCKGYINQVQIGRHDLTDNTEEYETFDIVEEIPHPKYDHNTLDFDYMMVRLDGKSTYLPVELDNGEISLDKGLDVIVMGWGTTSSGGSTSLVLLEVEVDISNQAQCQAVYQPLFGSGAVTDRMICAARSGTDSCQGDSGGPIIDKATGKQVGIVSWGQDCDNTNYPGVYAKVQDQIGWINSYIDIWTDMSTVSRLAAPIPITASLTPLNCEDEPDWYNIFGDDCKWYENNDEPGCPINGSKYDGGKGNATEACCYCGGGIDGNSTPAPSTPPAPTPSPSAFICKDSEERFEVTFPNGRKKNTSCKWVKRVKTKYKCNKVVGVKENCPLTCTNCCRDTTEPFKLKANRNEKTCDWAKKMNTELRCRKAPTRWNCPFTCGRCRFTDL